MCTTSHETYPLPLLRPTYLSLIAVKLTMQQLRPDLFLQPCNCTCHNLCSHTCLSSNNWSNHRQVNIRVAKDQISAAKDQSCMTQNKMGNGDPMVISYLFGSRKQFCFSTGSWSVSSSVYEVVCQAS